MVPLLIGLGAIAVGAVLPAIRLRARRQAGRVARAQARAAYERLGFCVETLGGGADEIATRALADAAERWHTAGALLAATSTPEELAVAEEAAREGLGFVSQACRRLCVLPPEPS